VGALIDRLDRALGLCERLFLALANWCLAAMLVANMLNIASRALFDKGLVYVFPWSVVLFVWMTFLGFFVVYRRGKDITVEFVVDRLGPWARLASRLLVDVLVIALMAIMLIQAPRILASQVGVIEMTGLQRYALSLPLFTSCALILLSFALDIVNACLGRAAPRHSPVGDI
jgi:TRAP-type C4-dicarboxylate transport system permease small subunit